MTSWRVALALLVLAAVGSVSGVQAAPEDGRLVYEIRMSAAGTRSQGWRGQLLERNGRPVELAAGQRVETPLGPFEGVRCVHPWSTCGAVHAGMLGWMKTHSANVVMGSDNWSWRVFVLGEGTRSEGYQGVLMRGQTELRGCSSPILTPLGLFSCRERTNLWDRAGWFHESWPVSKGRD